MRILLVDDEDFIRKGMCYTIPWEDYGFEVSEASNGAEALDIALRIRPDIVLTDISMPVMDGFELTRKLNQSVPDARVIILTAYDTLDNLKEAIDVQVSGFLVKSANSQEILNTVLKLKEELEREHLHNEKLNQIQDIFNENQMLIKQTLVHRFLKKEISFSHFAKKCSDLVVSLERVPIALMLIQCSCTDEKYATGQLLQYFRDYSPLCFFTENHVAVLILDTSSKILDSYAMEQLLPSIQPLVFGNFIAVMTSIQSWQDLPPAFQLLQQMLSHCFWNTEVPYIITTPMEKFESMEKITPYDYEKDIMKAMLSGKKEELQTLFDRYYDFMKTHKALRQDFLDSALRLIIFASSVRKDDVNIDEFDRLIQEAETPREVLELVSSLFLPAPSEKEKDSTSQIQAALDYMKENFTEDLHLEDVAKVVYLSPGYFCRVFKKVTGSSFKEYLHRLRIEKAKELIVNTDYKYYEIAEMVGYKNYKYFSSYFNKITGYSAREYRHKK
ncbi:response regulator [Ruminococcus sp. CLA-AA-H200]|uniref:Stage 0 sporulation protein A homolog n=1 Tax=Ruminococcus turbiniformis TaxID=2881258 RepID=A0ABS8G2Y8_9FIRM|nr:response regulator [Ruminococcus turbiniformis]MCC2255757.1 response regulator [Ruminococcus turbiniformis]